MNDYVLKSEIPSHPNMNDYIHKNKVPACPKNDMTNYIHKSKIPACPKCPTCPECPDCPDCPDISEVNRLYAIANDIKKHPQYQQYFAECHQQKDAQHGVNDRPENTNRGFVNDNVIDRNRDQGPPPPPNDMRPPPGSHRQGSHNSGQHPGQYPGGQKGPLISYSKSQLNYNPANSNHNTNKGNVSVAFEEPPRAYPEWIEFMNNP